jgi:hypothetical protein
MRIGSQGTVIMISDEATVTPITIVSATKAKPCVITVAAGPAPVVGDIIVPRNTAWNSIDAMPFKVSAVTAGAVTLEGSDTTNEPNNINTTVVPVGTIEVPTFIELCRSTLNITQPAGATIDVTTLCDIAHRIVPGLPALATWTAAGFYDCTDAAIDRAANAYQSGEKVTLDVRNADGCGVTFMAIVNTFDLTWAVNAAIGNTIGGQIDGRVNRYRTPAPGFVVRLPQALQPAMRPSTDASVQAQQVAA